MGFQTGSVCFRVARLVSRLLLLPVLTIYCNIHRFVTVKWCCQDNKKYGMSAWGRKYPLQPSKQNYIWLQVMTYDNCIRWCTHIGLFVKCLNTESNVQVGINVCAFHVYPLTINSNLYYMFAALCDSNVYDCSLQHCSLEHCGMYFLLTMSYWISRMFTRQWGCLTCLPRVLNYRRSCLSCDISYTSFVLAVLHACNVLGDSIVRRLGQTNC